MDATCAQCQSPGYVDERRLEQHRWPGWHDVPQSHPFRPVGISDEEFAVWLDWRADEREDLMRDRIARRNELDDIERAHVAQARYTRNLAWQRHLSETGAFYQP